NVASFSGDKNLTFSVLADAPNGSHRTVTDKTSAAVSRGTATTITFASGTSSAGGSLVAKKAEGPVTLAATDGTLSTSTTGGTGGSRRASWGGERGYSGRAATCKKMAGGSDAAAVKLVERVNGVLSFR